MGANTTLGVVATNAILTKTAGHQGGADGPRRLRPRAVARAHPGDGDVVFALATGTWRAEGDVASIGALAAEVMADAIVRAARQATGSRATPRLAISRGRRTPEALRAALRRCTRPPSSRP